MGFLSDSKLKRKIRKILKDNGIEKEKINDLVEDLLEELSDEDGADGENQGEGGNEGNSELDKLKEEHAKELAMAKLSSKIEIELAKVQSKNNKAVMALLETGELKLNDKGELEGLDEQLKKVVEENPFLFGVKQNYDPKAGGEPKGFEADIQKAMKQKDFNMTDYLKNLQKEK